MQYHALSLAREASTSRVFLVGYRGERAVPAVEAETKITQVLLAADLLPRPRARALYLLYAPLKAVLQLLQLMWTLLVVLPRANVLLLQTPPAVPVLIAVWVVRLLRGGAVVVDWHNLGFSVLSHALGNARHPFVRISYAYERLLGRVLDGHLCVTHAMAAWLRDEWALRDVRVLHDRPPEFFRRLEPSERHELLRRLKPHFVDAHGAPLWPDGDGTNGGAWADGGTPWTEVAPGGEVRERAGRPRLLISSTSWTADEDFGLLLEALAAIDAKLVEAHDAARTGPRVVAVITGKGPLKAHYEARMRELGLTRVAICTMWLEPADYPRLLGSADLGVCLHTSTSGLDLPMKVLDMYGCGLPVCAVHFPCLHELVTHGTNGLVFRTSDELAQQLHTLLAPTDTAATALAGLQAGVARTEASRPRWAENWRDAARPLLLAPSESGKVRWAVRIAVLCAALVLVAAAFAARLLQ